MLPHHNLDIPVHRHSSYWQQTKSTTVWVKKRRNLIKGYVIGRWILLSLDTASRPLVPNPSVCRFRKKWICQKNVSLTKPFLYFLLCLPSLQTCKTSEDIIDSTTMQTSIPSIMPMLEMLWSTLCAPLLLISRGQCCFSLPQVPESCWGV